MFKEIQITLYDIFGYLLPGLLVLLFLVIVFWTLFWNSSPLPLNPEFPVWRTVLLILAAYMAGHLSQGLGNLLYKLREFKSAEAKVLCGKGRESLSKPLLAALGNGVASRFGLDMEKLSASEIYALCDEALLHEASLGEREIFIYREGFYRGTFVALVLLDLAVLLRVMYVPIRVSIAQATFEIERGPALAAAAVIAVGAILSYGRFRRFERHRVHRCLLRFLALISESKPPHVRESKTQSGT